MVCGVVVLVIVGDWLVEAMKTAAMNDGCA